MAQRRSPWTRAIEWTQTAVEAAVEAAVNQPPETEVSLGTHPLRDVYNVS